MTATTPFETTDLNFASYLIAKGYTFTPKGIQRGNGMITLVVQFPLAVSAVQELKREYHASILPSYNEAHKDIRAIAAEFRTGERPVEKELAV